MSIDIISNLYNVFTIENNKENIWRIFMKIGIIVVPMSFYVYASTNTRRIRIKRKYKYVKSGMTSFMIIDMDENHYSLNNSIWFWKWDAIEDWYSLDKEREINIKFYGYRIPILSLFPNIYSYSNYQLY